MGKQLFEDYLKLKLTYKRYKNNEIEFDVYNAYLESFCEHYDLNEYLIMETL